MHNFNLASHLSTDFATVAARGVGAEGGGAGAPGREAAAHGQEKEALQRVHHGTQGK